MSVQSNSGSGGGSLEATPSWSQLSSSPTISQQHITATAKSKEGILALRAHDRLGFSVKSILRKEVDCFGRVEQPNAEAKTDIKFNDAVNWKPNVSCQFS